MKMITNINILPIGTGYIVTKKELHCKKTMYLSNNGYTFDIRDSTVYSKETAKNIISEIKNNMAYIGRK